MKEEFAARAPRALPTTRLGRAALFAFGVGAAASAVGCADEPDVIDDDDQDAASKDASVREAGVSDRDATIAPVYGAPIFDAGRPDAAVYPNDPGPSFPVYGLPSIDASVYNEDAGNRDASTRRDAGNVVPIYGLAVPPDQPDNQ